MKRQVFDNGSTRISTDEDDRGVTIGRANGGEERTPLFIPWDGLTELTLDLVRRLGARPHA